MGRNKYIILFLLSTFALKVSARQYPMIKVPLAGATLMNFGSQIVIDPIQYPGINAGNLAQFNSSTQRTTIINTIELGLKNHSAFKDNAKVIVTASITDYFFLDGTTSSNPIPITLEIDFESGEMKKSNISNIFAFKNIYTMKVTITNVEVTSDASDINVLKATLANFIELNAGFQVERISSIGYNTLINGLQMCEDKETDELVIDWDRTIEAEAYELEYTFVDDYTELYYSVVPPNLIPFDFKNNSTRVTLTEPNYRFPLVYERGWILFRVRIIGRGGTNLEQPVYCKWTGLIERGMVSNFTNKFYHAIAHLNDSLNWQVASTFAEEGKRSDIVNYFDGTFRSRQTVTGMNLERQLPYDQFSVNQMGSIACVTPGNRKYREVIAGETIYDFQGRPAVNILPVPTNSKKIEYLRLLNISGVVNPPNTALKPYSWEDFDSPNFTCPNTHKLYNKAWANSGIMGAAAYYSPNNPNKLGFNAFIPDAGGYPFTQVSYLQDNTGRVAAQSGVGETFQFGNNHETRFYYAAPNQEELDRMFGTEVGDALRYQKNAVMDPNRQVSVTYMNPEGKTIATALAGKCPDNLEPLETLPTDPIEISLMNKNIINLDDKTLIAEHQFVVTSDLTEYTIDYSIVPESLKAQICTKKEVCLDCIYDIEITLNHVESCTGIPIYSFSGTIGKLLSLEGISVPGSGGIFENEGSRPVLQNGYRPDKVKRIDLKCDNTATTGNYDRQITKTLDIGTYVLTKKITVNQQAAEAYMEEVFKDTCKTKWNEFLDSALEQIDTMDCYQSCESCDQPPVQTPLCNTDYCHPNPNRCDIIKEMMLADVSPGGQYAQFVRNSDGTIDASAYPLSIYNTDNILPADNYPNLIDLTGLFPSTITNYIDLVNNWLPEYAEKLLPMHPEHCLLGWCDDPIIDATLDFDVEILSTQHYANAITKGFITQGSTLPHTGTRPYETLLNADPWFNTTDAQILAIKQTLLTKLQQYPCNSSTSAEVLAMQMAFCAPNPLPSEVPSGIPAMDPDPQCTVSPPTYFNSHGFGDVPALADLEWKFLRALYISAKNRAIEENMGFYSNTNNCNIRCIGSEYYNFWAIHLNNTFPPSQSYEPCHSPIPFNWMFYQDKQSRFSTGISNILSVMVDAGISVDLSGITDFDDPCQFGTAIANQEGSINQQFANIMCGGGDSTCEVGAGLISTINTVITKLQSSPNVTLPLSQLPLSISSEGITSVYGQYIAIPVPLIRIVFNQLSTGACSFDIPYLLSGSSAIAPISVCCIASINCPGNINCSFDLTVTYPQNLTQVIRANTKCNLLSDCINMVTLPATCAQLTANVVPLKDYLKAVFNFRTANANYPTSNQLKTLLPTIFQGDDIRPIHTVTLTYTGNFEINLAYYDPRGRYRNCPITLTNNAAIGNWSNVKTILSIAPDYSQIQNTITNHFILKVLVGTDMSNLTAVTVNGYAPCLDMNQCPPEVTLCDSLIVLPPYPEVNNCVENLIATAHLNAGLLYHNWVDSMKNDLLEKYYAKCLSALETLNMKYEDKQYHYTLYYYDQAGNLVKTVPPAGVKLYNHNEALLVANSRANNYNVPKLPDHFKRTVYRYNTLNEMLWQKTPDAGESNFFYDGLGRIVASQNAQQLQDGNFFSYIKFDLLGRVVESGKINSSSIDATFTRNFDTWTNFINTNTARTEITLTRYDESSISISQKFGIGGQKNLRMRVASVFSFANSSLIPANSYIHATHYSYDIMGNVYKLIQDYPNGIIGDKTIDYDFDLQSGKVNKVTYQKDAIDQFIHKYKYDAANRLTHVKTSTNGLVWETDAEYKYYRHGPLARMELGTDKVQGLDYLYTLQGWIKAVNGIADTSIHDMGQDGILDPSQTQTVTIDGITYTLFQIAQMFGTNFNGPGYATMNNPVAKDAFGYVLEYFNTDYNPILGNDCLDGMQLTAGTMNPLYNGNISRMYTQIQTLGNNGYNYKYDQLNRIKSQLAWKIDNNSMAMLPGDEYMGTFTYDPDGNIMNQFRNGKDPIAMDNLTYFYYDANGGTFDPSQGIPTNATNKLAHVSDQVADNNYPTEDIDGQNTNNYQYNLIGNLISDADENISLIKWNLQNKITSIAKSTGPSLSFEYDAMGNRVKKNVTGGTPEQNAQTFYVRDAQGNTIATYAYRIPFDGSDNTEKLYWSEAHIYGSSRIGLYSPDTILEGPFVPNETVNVYYTTNRGYKQYELSNHLGNVLATISDRKLPVIAADFTITYKADILSGQDYYAFGMLMPGRKVIGEYRYGFNGKENDDDVKGDGNQQDYGFRIYDPRLGKFLSVDPLERAFPMLSAYQFAGNSPISNIDLDGREPENFMYGWKRKLLGITSLQMNNMNHVIGEIQEQHYKIYIGKPQKSVEQLYNQISKDINSIYVTSEGDFSFAKQQRLSEVTKGDIIQIDPSAPVMDIAVKVTDVTKYNSGSNNGMLGVDGPHTGFSVTFRSLEGHVEVGVITFTALEFTNPKTGEKTFQFSISSTSQIDVGVGTVFYNQGSRNAQQSVWHQVLNNVASYMGGDIRYARQCLYKYTPDEYSIIDNEGTTLGAPKEGSSPETECKEIECTE